jgi:hypothetical protein
MTVWISTSARTISKPMNPSIGAVIYWIIQIIFFSYALFVVRRVRDQRNAPPPPMRRDSRRTRILLYALTPLMAFAYFIVPSLVDHKTLHNDQIWLAIISSGFVSFVSFLRFRRQGRSLALAPAPTQAVFRYRAKDGSICGPDTRERLMVLRRMGAIDNDTPIAAYGTSENWHPFSRHPDIHASSE